MRRWGNMGLYLAKHTNKQNGQACPVHNGRITTLAYQNSASSIFLAGSQVGSGFARIPPTIRRRTERTKHTTNFNCPPVSARRADRPRGVLCASRAIRQTRKPTMWPAAYPSHTRLHTQAHTPLFSVRIDGHRRTKAGAFVQHRVSEVRGLPAGYLLAAEVQQKRIFLSQALRNVAAHERDGPVRA